MAASQENLYDSLADDAKNLRELGKSWGLNDADIDGCFQRALLPDGKAVRSLSVSRKRRACRWLCLSICCVTVLVVASFCLVKVHKPSKQFVMRQAQGLMYPVMRTVRMMSMPFREIFDVSGLHELECILPNPFFGGFEEDGCWPCKGMREVRVFRNLTNFTMYYYHSGIPLVVKDANSSLVTFDDLKAVYLDNTEQLKYSAHKVQSSNPYIRSIGDFLTPTRRMEDILGTDLHIQWRVQKAGGVRLIRDLSPKPYFVPRKSEVASEMFVLLRAPAADVHPLPLTDHPNVWLTQAYGSQEVTLSPTSTCKEKCTDVRIVLEPSDALYYVPRFWQGSTFSFGDQVSISFQGSFF